MPTDPELLDRPYHFLLEVEHGAGLWRFSDTDLDVLDNAGDVFSYLGELDEPTFTRELGVFETDAEADTFSAEVVVPEDRAGGGLARLQRQGYTLGGRRAWVRLWWEDTPLERAVLLLEGRVADPRVGADGEPVGLSVEAVPLEDDAPFLEAEARVDDESWPDHASGAAGAAYPFVFGHPYRFSRVDGTGGVTSGSPALYVDTTNGLFLIADGETEAGSLFDAGAPGQSQVRLYDVQGGLFHDADAFHTTDGRGRRVTVVDASGAAAAFFDADGEYVVRWDAGGGVLGPSSLQTSSGSGRQPLTLAGDVVTALLRRSPLAFDPDRLAALARYLNGYEVAGYFDDPEAGAVELAVDHFLEPFLVSFTAGPRGRRFVPVNLDGRPEDALAHLEVGFNCDREGPGRSEGGDRVVNRVRLSYALRDRTGEPQTFLEIVGDDPMVARSPWQVFSPAAWESQRRYGRREVEAESVVLYEADSALAQAEHQVRALGFAQDWLDLVVSPAWLWLPLGGAVVVSDDELKLIEARALVGRQTIRLDAVELSVWLLPGALNAA